MIKTDNSYAQSSFLSTHDRARFVQSLGNLALAGDRDPAENMVRELGYSRPHLRRICRLATGESFAAFVRRIRLESAAGKLSLSEAKVAAVALGAGYATVQAFSKAFALHFGTSPTDFAELNPGSERLLPGYRLQHGLPLASIVALQRPNGGLVQLHYEGLLFLAVHCQGERLAWHWCAPLR